MRVELDQDRLDPRLLKEDLERVEGSLQLTREIFGRMLRFARGTNRMPGGAEVARAVAGACDLLRDGLAKQKVALVTRIADGLPPVRCGSSDLERLFFNLLSNARDAMPGGGVLTIEATSSGGVLEIVVIDTGTGMTPEMLREIERPFFTTKEHGSGLGISTCRSIISEAGGELMIESAPGVGTRVTMRLPVMDES